MLTVEQFADMLNQWHLAVPLVFSFGGTDGTRQNGRSRPDPEGTAPGGEGSNDAGRAPADQNRVDAAGEPIGR